MADNSTLDPGAGGDTYRSKDRAGVKTSIVGIDLAPGGAETLMNGAMPVTDNGGSLTVDVGTALPAGANAIGKLAANSGVDIGDVDVTTVPGTVADGAAGLPAVLYVVGGWDGTNVQALATDATGLLQVDVATAPTTAVTGPLTDAQLRAAVVPVSDGAGSLTVDNAGTFAVQIAANSSVNQAQVAGTTTDTNSGNKSAGTQRVVLATDQPALTNALKVDGSAVTQPVSGPLTDAQLRATVVPVQDVGNVAHDGADSGNPVKVGARALTADITAVAANDRVDAIATTLGKQVVQPYALPGQSTNGMLASALTGTTAADVIAAPGANIRLCITEITVTNNHATVGTKVEIRDGTTVKKVISCPALGGGASISMPTALRLTANTALTCRPVTTGADIDCSATGYTALE